MPIEIIKKEEQVDGGFNHGAILEKRPVIMQHKALKTHPYSNLFYWAHAWSELGSTIGEHPHQGFEILSFVLKGSIRHYDSKNKQWIPLSEGDAQIIQSGSGISHAEHLEAGSEIFQIWFDPNIFKTIKNPPSYNDFKSSDFPTETSDRIITKTYKGANAPIEMIAEGVSIKELTLKTGEHLLSLSAQSIYSCFVLEGELMLEDTSIMKGDFFKCFESTSLSFVSISNSKLFIIESPLETSYPTYVNSH